MSKLWVPDFGLSSPSHFTNAQRNKKGHSWIVPCKAHIPSPTKGVDYQNEKRAMVGVLWQQRNPGELGSMTKNFLGFSEDFEV